MFADYNRGALDVVREKLDKLTAKKNMCGRAKVTAEKEESSDEEPEVSWSTVTELTNFHF